MSSSEEEEGETDLVKKMKGKSRADKKRILKELEQ
jgi:hypothetical protein